MPGVRNKVLGRKVGVEVVSVKSREAAWEARGYSRRFNNPYSKLGLSSIVQRYLHFLIIEAR